jgi:hypothetical protein
MSSSRNWSGQPGPPPWRPRTGAATIKRLAERLWAGVSMTESRPWGPSLEQAAPRLGGRLVVPQPTKVSHDGGHADRSGARVPRCTPTGLNHAAVSVVSPGRMLPGRLSQTLRAGVLRAPACSRVSPAAEVSCRRARRTPCRQLRKQRRVPRISISDQGAPKDRTATPAKPRSASCFEATSGPPGPPNNLRSCFGASDHGPVSLWRVGQSVDLPGKARRWGHDLRGSRQSGCLTGCSLSVRGVDRVRTGCWFG